MIKVMSKKLVKKAIAEEGRITIATRAEAGYVHVAIRDTGSGIAPEALASIFDPNFTARDSVVRASMGLSICYQIAREHRGRIEAASELGKGSVFTVVLPLDLAPSALPNG